ncbi:hypothetical protein ABFS82_14G318600 [Erythranthe guttata]|uniref:RING-type domain-containing protein n=1 Tax=Erythranthe guttata TaxID=4155 RepID=A0A022Q5N8_ERYGU|nr:PREDICTED: receptor homology region, transmembrane domain- and RING domain-containing protein 2 [Erythranthe guttata]EYU23957.1 hypothetical protein MIMGU_mgv1a007515mg [Erythranthe guttata]|eukprot:XP_012853423.1 PREDICTED: receptor homology region, transmembrane domain- and RING domain-containing protein 2 [Erythranthe guttata]
MGNLWVFLCFNFWLIMCAFAVSGTVVLIGNNVTLSFQDIEANFAPSVNASGKCGTLHVAEPLDACSSLTNKINPNINDTRYPFVLIIRGGCSFETKVRRAQTAGFKAAIVYDNENGDLVAMAGNPAGIKINAAFVSRASGRTLAKYAGAADAEIWIAPSFENSAWSIMAISFISLLAMSAVLGTCFFVRRHRIRRGRPRGPRVREFHGISSRLVKAMPSLIFTAVLEDNCTSQTCAICLEDYDVGDKLRILPCRHKFHAMCVDTWLTSWRTFCPVCKRDARTSNGEVAASESTPLLSVSSSALQIGESSYNHNSASLQANNVSTTRSSVDLRNMSSQRSDGAYVVSPNSLGLNTRYMSAYIPRPSDGSSYSYVGSSSRQHNALHHNESATSFSPFASAQSLPGC